MSEENKDFLQQCLDILYYVIDTVGTEKFDREKLKVSVNILNTEIAIENERHSKSMKKILADAQEMERRLDEKSKDTDALIKRLKNDDKNKMISSLK